MPEGADSKAKKKCDGNCDCPDCGAGKRKTEAKGEAGR